MNTKKIKVFLLFVGLISIVVLLSSFFPTLEEESIVHTKSSQYVYQNSIMDKKLTYNYNNNNVSKIHQKKRRRLKEKSLYTPFDVKIDQEENSGHVPRKDIPSVSEFSVDTQQFQKMHPGDHFMLPQINGEIFEGVVATAQKGIAGSIRIFAHIQGEDDRSFIQITIGKKVAYYTIQSTGGKYTGKSMGKIGYLYHSDVIMNAVAVKRSPDAIDYLIPYNTQNR